MVYLKYKPSKLQIEHVSDELKFVRYMCGGRISSFGRSLAVVEEITEAVSKIVDIVDMMPNESTAVDESIGEDDSVEVDLGVKNLPHSSGGFDFEDELIDVNLNNIPSLTQKFGGIPGWYLCISFIFSYCSQKLFSDECSPQTSAQIRNWNAEKCNFCSKFETGHKCKRCSLPCCNLCNRISVDELSDIICPNCSIPVELLDEFVPEEHEAAVDDESSDTASASPALAPIRKKMRGQSIEKKTDKNSRVRGHFSVEDSSEDSSEEDDVEDSTNKPTEHRLMGKNNVLKTVFVDESLTCESPIEAHLFDVLIMQGKPLPCSYCGEKDPLKISSTLSDAEYPLCKQCPESGRGAAPRRKSRKLKVKATKQINPAKKSSAVKRKRSSL